MSDNHVHVGVYLAKKKVTVSLVQQTLRGVNDILESSPSAAVFPTSSPGRYYRRGEIFWLSDQCSQRCRCLDIDNEVQCQEAPCGQLETCEQQEGAFYCQPTRTSTCVVFGDPHYHTFDGFLYHFQGTCSYLLARPCWEVAGLPFFSVEAKNENRGVASVSWLRDVTVEVYGHRVMLPKGSFGTVQVRIFGPVYIGNYHLVHICGCIYTLRSGLGRKQTTSEKESLKCEEGSIWWGTQKFRSFFPSWIHLFVFYS